MPTRGVSMVCLNLKQNLTALLRQCAVWLALSTPAASVAQSCPPLPAALTPQQVQTLTRDAKDRGFLWKIEKDGRTGYLYGSMHLGKQAWAVPGPRTLAALKASEVVALELDILDPSIQAQMADPSRFGIKPVVLPSALQTRMNAFARKVCLPPTALAKQHPLMQLVAVTLFDARFSGLEIGYGSEIFLADFARSVGKPVIGLETAESQMRALLQGDAAETIASVDRGLMIVEQGKSRAVNRRMADAWAAGNLPELENYQRWCECVETHADRKALQRLNDERNPGLAAGIDKLMRGNHSNHSVFAAVGALHMTGPKALPKLMQEMGYQVERVVFDRF